MCRKLGANFEVDTLHFKPFIINPANSQKKFVIWDPSHMIKLARNVLGDKKIIVYGNGGHTGCPRTRGSNLQGVFLGDN
jgi:hypothetical protein